MNDELIYLDTNIYMDYLENRTDRLRPIGEFAFNLIRKSINCEYKIIISSLVILELKFNGYNQKIQELIHGLKMFNKLVYIQEAEEDDKKARQIRREMQTPLNDMKHAVIAHRMKAKFLVTRNIKDFERLHWLVSVIYPENL